MGLKPRPDGPPRFLIWSAPDWETVWVFESPDDLLWKHRRAAREGRLSAEWPAEVIVKVKEDYHRQGDGVLADCHPRSREYPIVSNRLRDFLVARDVPFESVPIQLARGETTLSNNYSIVNPTRWVDAINVDACNIKWNSIDPTLVTACDQLVLRPKKTDGLPLFRLRGLPYLVFVTTTLANDLVGAGFSHLHFYNPLLYKGILSGSSYLSTPSRS